MTGPHAEDEVVLICDERVTSIPSSRVDDALVDAGEHLPIDSRKADVTLTTPEGIELDLGCPVDAPEQSRGRCYTAHPEVTGEARWLRRELSAALAGAGLVNYPTEWWHWSYGDRYWAFVAGATSAHYDPV